MIGDIVKHRTRHCQPTPEAQHMCKRAKYVLPLPFSTFPFFEMPSNALVPILNHMPSPSEYKPKRANKEKQNAANQPCRSQIPVETRRGYKGAGGVK